jgi:hypothetical protein
MTTMTMAASRSASVRGGGEGSIASPPPPPPDSSAFSLDEAINNDDSQEVVDAKLLERAGVLIATLVSTPMTGAAEEERREKVRALRADGWIPEGCGPPGECDGAENLASRPRTLRSLALRCVSASRRALFSASRRALIIGW